MSSQEPLSTPGQVRHLGWPLCRALWPSDCPAAPRGKVLTLGAARKVHVAEAGCSNGQRDVPAHGGHCSAREQHADLPQHAGALAVPSIHHDLTVQIGGVGEAGRGLLEGAGSGPG